MSIQDSGNRRRFSSGAVRDIQEGKGRCDLLPLFQIASYASQTMPKIQHELAHIYEFMDDGNCEHLFDAIKHFVIDNYPNPETAILELSKHYEEGAMKYGEHNWEKGIPLHCYIDSGVRHLLKFSRGDEDEPHARAFLWNLFGAIWTCEHYSIGSDMLDIPAMRAAEISISNARAAGISITTYKPTQDDSVAWVCVDSTSAGTVSRNNGESSIPEES